MSLGNFLKGNFPDLYVDFAKHKYSRHAVEESYVELESKKAKDEGHFSEADLCWVPVIALSKDHPANQFIQSRKIPQYWGDQLYYTGDFSLLARQIDPTSTLKTKADCRVVIPYRSPFPDGDILRVSGRAIAPHFTDQESQKSVRRYLHIDRPDKDFKDAKIFRLANLDTTKKFYVVEGQIDSMFIDNAIAIGGANLASADVVQCNKNNAVLVPDNEPRSKAIVTMIASYIKNGYNVVIWPDEFPYKDINEAIVGGVCRETLMHIIETNTVSGLKAATRFAFWRKDNKYAKN
jgi:hypothetical protein